MRRLIVLLAVLALMVMALPAAANPVCGDAKIHPGHCGYIASGQQNSKRCAGEPLPHWRGWSRFSAQYPARVPGVGAMAVSDAAKGQGLKKAHGG